MAGRSSLLKSSKRGAEEGIEFHLLARERRVVLCRVVLDRCRKEGGLSTSCMPPPFAASLGASHRMDRITNALLLMPSNGVGRRASLVEGYGGVEGRRKQGTGVERS